MPQVVQALAWAPVGALALALAGVGSIGGQDPLLVGAVAGAAAGYMYGDKFAANDPLVSDGLASLDNQVLIGAAAAGFLFGPAYGYSPAIGAAIGGGAGFALAKSGAIDKFAGLSK
jgi:hypothetical protein